MWLRSHCTVSLVGPVVRSGVYDIGNGLTIKELISRDGPSVDQLLDVNYLTQMQMKDLPKILYAYTNSKVDTGLSGLGSDFFKWLPLSKVSAKKQQKILVQNLKDK